MKQNLLILAVMVVVVLFFMPHHAGAQCPEQPSDLGECDTLYVETFDSDHVYYAYPGSFDSVRVAIYITHDSNTFWWQGAGRWVQDSIRGMDVPFIWWPSGCADSIVFPTYDHWNNKDIYPDLPWMNRSIFRHLVDEHTGDTVYNRMLQMVENGKYPWSCYIDSRADSVLISVVPMHSSCQSWWEGSRVLLATLTFLVYMGEDCHTAGICLDSCSWPISPELFVGLNFFNYPGTAIYVPRHFLPVCDTIYRDTHGDANGDGRIDLADAVYLVNWLFNGGPPPDPLEAGDANCNGEVNFADAVYIVNWLFIGGSPPGCP